MHHETIRRTLVQGAGDAPNSNSIAEATLSTWHQVAVRLGAVSPDAQGAAAVPLVALVACAGFVLWGCVGKGQAEANRFGAPTSI